MPLVDVGFLMTDPDFVAPVQHIYRTTQVNSLGENILTECCNDTVGSVQPVSGKDLLRLPEDLRVANLYTFWIKGKITTSETGQYTDLLTFRGLKFAVKSVNDWSTWGSGWTEGLCVAQRPIS